jgi:predicted MFS family arabinose efflux permease
VAAFLLAALAFAGTITPAWILVLTFALGLGTALNGPAWQAIQPDLVPRPEFSQALALGALTYNVGRAIGPALGGLVLAAAGPAWVFAVNAASFLGTVAVLFAWRAPRRTTRLPAETLYGATRAALRYGAHAPLLRRVLLHVAVLAVPAAAIQALLPVVVRDSLHLGSGVYGGLLACFGLGAAAAALLRPRIEERLAPDGMVALATVLLGLGIVANGVAANVWVVGAVLALAGMGWTTAFTTTNVAAQSTLAGWVRARGMGLYMLVLTGGIAVGSALWGVLATWNLRGAHLAAAGALAAGWALTRSRRLDPTRTVDVTPFPAPDPLVTLVPRPDDGPVLVTLAYRVADEDADAFTAEMRQVERHRRRTGAYQWGLFRDLADPERFVETFVVASWAEHLRQHERRTASFADRLELSRAYTSEPVVVDHLVSAYSAGARTATPEPGVDAGAFS